MEPDSLQPRVGRGRALKAAAVHFVGRISLTCSEGDDACVALLNRFDVVQGNPLVFLLRLLFYFSSTYSVFRYYGVVAEVKSGKAPKDDDTLGLQTDVVKQCAHVGSIAAATLIALVASGVNFTQIGVFGGLIGAGLSVALRDVLANFVAGILLLWDKTIKRDDVITIAPSENAETGSTYAIVRKMTMRYTVVEDRNEVRRLIPNSILTNSVVENWTHESKDVRLRITVGIAYGSDLKAVKSLLESVCYEVPRVLTRRRPPQALIIDFADSAIIFSLRFWISDAHKGIRPVISAVYLHIWERFAEEGVVIPFPQRVVHVARGETGR